MIVGALRRWTWAFWVALVIFGLGAFGTILGGDPQPALPNRCDPPGTTRRRSSSCSTRAACPSNKWLAAERCRNVNVRLDADRRCPDRSLGL
jgi:hypothetical protein